MNEQALKDHVHAIAKEKGIPFNECWKQLLLVRFLQNPWTNGGSNSRAF